MLAEKNSDMKLRAGCWEASGDPQSYPKKHLRRHDTDGLVN
jgi:hypothetical protein